MPNLTDEQQRAVESIDSNVLVSAGAGSGKTMVLVERFIRVLQEDPESSVNDIVAVTFTRKAAEEMRTRLKDRLKSIAAAASDEEHERWNKLLGDVDHARIGTIHSLCESVLRAFPAEAAVDPQFEIMDDLHRAQIIHDCVENSLQQLISEPDSDDLILLEYPIESIRKWVIGQLDRIPQYKESRSRFGENGNELEEQALKIMQRVRVNGLKELFSDGVLQRGLSFIQDNPWPDRDNKLEICRAQIAGFLMQLMSAKEHIDTGDDACQRCSDLVKEIAEVPSPGSSGGPKGKPLRDALASVRNSTKKFVDLCPSELNESDQQAFSVLRALMRVIDRAITEYETNKLTLQRLDYNDLIIKTHALLCAPGSQACKQFGEGLKAVLVDEFQDTNFTQSELLSSLCKEGARLFLIGDDKQSIYKFQGADVSTFNQWKELIRNGTHGLQGDSELLDLSFSFRSHPSIVEFVNRFFQFYFHSQANSAQAPHKAQHRALTASRTDEHEAARVEVVVYDTTDGEQKRQSEKAKLVESKAIAAWILEKLGADTEIFDKHIGATRPMSFGDFAVLVQVNDDFAAIESALSDAGIPYVTYAGSGFLNRQEILDVENMLRFLLCGEDDHALLAVLRSPFFGINDGVIHRIYTERNGSTLWSALQRAAKTAEFTNLAPVVATLKKLVELPGQLPLSDIIRNVVLSTSYDVVSLSLPNGRQKSRNVWKFTSFSKEYNHLPLSEFLAALASMRELGITKQTDAPLNAENSVKLMTVHKSKGLEFPAVALPVMGKKVHLFTPKLLLHGDFGIAFDTTRSSDEQKPAFYRAAHAVNCELDAEEKKRLLYVAMTRARDFLVMFIERAARNETSFRLWLKEALALDADESDGGERSKRAQLFEKEHYCSRYFDDIGVEDWEAAGRESAAKYLTKPDVESMSNRVNFDLISSLDEPAGGEAPTKPIHWQRAERVTLSSKKPVLHATVVGNLFHAVMQQVVNSGVTVTRDLIEKLTNTHGINVVEPSLKKKLVDRVEQLAAAFDQSSLKELLSSARRVMAEINYTVVANDKDIDKRPDLILQDEHEQWRIIDFKTDQMTAAQIPEKVNEHSRQVLQYAQDFEAITGYKATGWLYFADIGHLEAVEGRSYNIGKKGQLQLF